MSEAEVVANEILNNEPYRYSLAYKSLAAGYLDLQKAEREQNKKLILYDEQNRRVIRFLSSLKPILTLEGYNGLAENCVELMVCFKRNESTDI